MAVYGGQMTAPKVLADIVESMAAAVYIDCGFNIQMIWSIFRSLLEPLVTLDGILAQPQPITALYGACRKDGKRVDIRYSKNGESLLLGHGVWGLGWGVGWGKTPKPPSRVGLGWGVGLGAWLSSRRGAVWPC
ncbi:putative ribonuclease III [Helianthus debilis subsp. tardiflorus]